MSKQVIPVCYLPFDRHQQVKTKDGEVCLEDEGEGNGSNTGEGNGFNASCS